MKRQLFPSQFLLLLLILVMGAVVACTPAENDAPTATPTLDPDAPVSSDDPTAEPVEQGDLIIGTAIVNSVDLLMLESFPLQMTATINGDFPDGCTTLGAVQQERIGNVINMTIGTSRPAGSMCTQALVPFTENVSVDIYGLPAGEYTVNVNGVTTTFTLDMDNIIAE